MFDGSEKRVARAFAPCAFGNIKKLDKIPAEEVRCQHGITANCTAALRDPAPASRDGSIHQFATMQVARNLRVAGRDRFTVAGRAQSNLNLMPLHQQNLNHAMFMNGYRRTSNGQDRGKDCLTAM